MTEYEHKQLSEQQLMVAQLSEVLGSIEADLDDIRVTLSLVPQTLDNLTGAVSDLYGNDSPTLGGICASTPVFDGESYESWAQRVVGKYQALRNELKGAR